MSYSKMYILVRDDVIQKDIGHAILGVAHGVAACSRKFSSCEDYTEWELNSFRKVLCRLNDKEFENAKKYADKVLMTESALDGEETCMVFCPRKVYPDAFKWYKLWK